MLLVVSHYTRNKGTTDYFLDFLRVKKIGYYYLRHSFYGTNINKSQLFFFDGQKEKLIKEYTKSDKQILSLIQDFFLNFIISLKFNYKLKKVISFGSFNTIGFIIDKFLFKRTVVFWGVDYSVKRFNNYFLNKIYYLFETISCLYANIVINATVRQEKARIDNHKLKIEKSLIVPNGVSDLNLKQSLKNNTISFLYIGSITSQHGIIKFLEEMYVKRGIKNRIYIYGGGNLDKKLENMIKDNNLLDRVIFKGYANKKDISDFILKVKENLFGIAPYRTDASADHVFYGDSLKVKEYLSFGIPFITSDILFLEEDFKKYGYVYKDFDELYGILKEKIYNFHIEESKLKNTMNQYIYKDLYQSKLYSIFKD